MRAHAVDAGRGHRRERGLRWPGTHPAVIGLAGQPTDLRSSPRPPTRARGPPRAAGAPGTVITRPVALVCSSRMPAASTHPLTRILGQTLVESLQLLQPGPVCRGLLVAAHRRLPLAVGQAVAAHDVCHIPLLLHLLRGLPPPEPPASPLALAGVPPGGAPLRGAEVLISFGWMVGVVDSNHLGVVAYDPFPCRRPGRPWFTWASVAALRRQVLAMLAALEIAPLPPTEIAPSRALNMTTRLCGDSPTSQSRPGLVPPHVIADLGGVGRCEACGPLRRDQGEHGDEATGCVRVIAVCSDKRPIRRVS